MRSSALHRGISLSIAALVGAALVGFASLAGAAWGVLAAVPVLTMVLLEASARRHPVAVQATGEHGDVLQLAPRAARPQACAELHDLNAYRAARAPRVEQQRPEGHLASVVQLPAREQREVRMRAHG